MIQEFFEISDDLMALDRKAMEKCAGPFAPD